MHRRHATKGSLPPSFSVGQKHKKNLKYNRHHFPKEPTLESLRAGPFTPACGSRLHSRCVSHGTGCLVRRYSDRYCIPVFDSTDTPDTHSNFLEHPSLSTHSHRHARHTHAATDCDPALGHMHLLTLYRTVRPAAAGRVLGGERVVVRPCAGGGVRVMAGRQTKPPRATPLDKATNGVTGNRKHARGTQNTTN